MREIEVIKSRNLQIEKDNAETIPLNQLYWERITNVIEFAESKGVRIYFYIPPRLKTDDELQTIHPIWQKLDERYKIRAEHFDESLYQAETSNDEHHLNHKGAMIFTKNLAEIFIQKKAII